MGMMKQAKEERRRGMRHVKGKTLRYSSERSGRHIRHPRNGGGLKENRVWVLIFASRKLK